MFVVLPRAREQIALEHALELTLLRGMVRHRTDGSYRINPAKRELVAYYARSIEHHFETDADAKQA